MVSFRGNEKIPPFSASRKEREENKGCPRMGILEQITQMKNQGIPDEKIVSGLQEQGVSPREINDALSQAQIKSAVSNAGSTEEMQMTQSPPAPSQQDSGTYIPKTQEMPEAPGTEQEMYAPQSQQESSPPQEYYQQDAYNYPSEGVDSNTLIEIAEQVFSEKIKKIQKQVEDINEFKTLAQTKIDNTAERLKRIEATIDKLQIAILEKIGSYGRNIESIKKEMSMMQDSFGKVVNQAVRGHAIHTPTKTSKKK